MELQTKAWRFMRLLAFYRILLSGLLILLIYKGILPVPLGTANPTLFQLSVYGYAFLALVAIYPLLLKTPHYVWQVYLLTSVDIVMFTLMMHASGGISSGVGMLLIISVANASMLLAGRLSIFFAALASIAVLIEQFYAQLYLTSADYNYSMAGLLGLALFVTSALSAVLAKQARDNADLAHERGLDLANMAELTEQVIRQMSTGVLVVDHKGGVRLINSSARRLLDSPSQAVGSQLQQFSHELSDKLHLWIKDPGLQTIKQRVDTLPASLLVQIVPISGVGDERKAGRLIFLEDANLIDEQAQQLRLAALGRLTAGIAHEIRNPLSAIRHAGALLAESPGLPEGDLRLTSIIQENTLRVNRIVEDVLHLGNRDRVAKELIRLKDWMQRFFEELDYQLPELKPILTLEFEIPESLCVRMDAGHLRQILTNLLANACYFGLKSSHAPRVVCRVAGVEGQTAFVEIINNGPPVEEENRSRLFEPFFTTTAKGTGLGLYLSRELAQANQCHLGYQQQQQLTCFRLSFGAQTIVMDV